MMLHSGKSRLLFSGYICRQCTYHLAQRFASNHNTSQNSGQFNQKKPSSNPKSLPPPLFSSPSPSQTQKNSSPSHTLPKNAPLQTQKNSSPSHTLPKNADPSKSTQNKPSISTPPQVGKVIPPPLFSSPSKVPVSPAPLFPSSSSSPSRPPSEFLSQKSSTKPPFTPPILTPKARPNNSAKPSTSDEDEIKKMHARESEEAARREQIRLAQIAARDEIFAPKNHAKAEPPSEGENYRELRQKAYEDLIRSSYATPAPAPPRKTAPTKEATEEDQKQITEELDKYFDNYAGALAEAHAKSTQPKESTPVSASSLPSSTPVASQPPPSSRAESINPKKSTPIPTTTSTHSRPSSATIPSQPSLSAPSSPASPSPPSPPSPPTPTSPSHPSAKISTHTNKHPNQKKQKKHDKTVPGESAKFAKSENSKPEKRAPRVPESVFYDPKPINEKEKVEREGELPKGLETRASKVQQFMQYAQNQMAQGQLPSKSKMRGLFEISVPSKSDPMSDNLKGFMEHREKLKSERQNK